jgi:hypothetical protein
VHGFDAREELRIHRGRAVVRASCGDMSRSIACSSGDVSDAVRLKKSRSILCSRCRSVERRNRVVERRRIGFWAMALTSARCACIA